jgi:molecular chaperone GrpE
LIEEQPLTHIKINTGPIQKKEAPKAEEKPITPEETLGSTVPQEETLEAQLETKKKEAQDNFDRFLRLSAEFENFKKRMEKEKNDAYKFGTENLIKELLPVLDNLERAIDHGEAKDPQGLLEGVDMTLKGFLAALEKIGVSPVDASGKEFDPNLHEAVMVQEDAHHPAGTVLTQLQKGYSLHSRLIRPAMVVVSKRPDLGPEEESLDQKS